jgi:HMG box factor, other
MLNHPLSWDRVLPAPDALLNGQANDLLPRRSSSLLQHHLVCSKDLLESSKDRRSTVPSISYHMHPGISPIHPILPLGSQGSSTSDHLPTGPLTRKRTATLMAEESKTRETSPAITQDSISETTNQFCLCQPDPKIPRPRNGMCLISSLFCCGNFLIRPFGSLLASPLFANSRLMAWLAFILYRQHHQAAVVAKHPGLPNPEISKIIGEEWRALPTKTKNQWKALAEVIDIKVAHLPYFKLIWFSM